MTTPAPIHPGEHLAEMLEELHVTQYRLAKTIGVPQVRIHQIVHGRRAVTADSALRIGRALGMTPDFWLNLQRMYDLDIARAKTDLSGIGTLYGEEKYGEGNAPVPLHSEGPMDAGGEGAYAAYGLGRLPAAALGDPEPDEPYGPKRKGG